VGVRLGSVRGGVSPRDVEVLCAMGVYVTRLLLATEPLVDAARSLLRNTLSGIVWRCVACGHVSGVVCRAIITMNALVCAACCDGRTSGGSATRFA
jgi:hypothetical protein